MFKYKTRHKILTVLVLSIFVSTATNGADRVTGEVFAIRSPVLATSAMAATSQPLATQVALDVMKNGGNAIDAAIAANALLGLVEPTGNGIGGDLFAIVWDAKTKKLYGLNASGRSPKSLSLEWFAQNGHQSIPSHGPLPVTVPGAVDGWFMLHDRFGKKPMNELLKPTIDYAREGFPVSQLIAYYWNRSIPLLERWPGFSEQFTIEGRAPAEGEIWKNPGLAKTLQSIADGGRDAFYKGDIAKTIANYMEKNGGFLSYEDLSSHTGNWVDPVSTNYRGYDVWELPPNGQGIAALQILNIIELFDISSMDHDSAEYVHLFTEVKKLVFEDRAKYYADSEFNKIPVTTLISKDYAQKRSGLLNLDRAANTYPAGKLLEEGDTIYLTTADKEGNMVSLIQSNYRGMGSGMTPDGLGFVLQDRGEMFSLEEGHFNQFEGGKRPFHTIIPAFVTKGGLPWMSFGLMGGAMQPQGHAQIVINMIDFEMDIQAAGDAPRIHHTGSSEPTGEVMINGGILNLETGYSYETIRQLMRMGHEIQYANGPYGGYQAIHRAPNGVYWGATETRKDGHAAGY
ncbi:gamma-glutamyltransferase [Porticoccaceae bacterium]|jgi:gamma-glutamyltranspeptidase/glutathione hydrolase|nr:gamma-glutamyltransferase [Porticoccaceae bacterium]MDA7768742.1 gamma-glutamyltransferase [Porticoccaceae bacterium]MDA8598503.1 gamma-glutamyltransferase [Porticoccaceae bacterium]MDA8878752.1 gamma-glutamyltransferase [Porticoccaceae bacterium]MDA8941598.1 gamma-glutamyltransferase [Porticoccaceae bacterium]